jgi:hypothetical protein
MMHMTKKPLGLAAALLAASLSYCACPMGIAPGVVVVGNVPPGKEVPAFPDADAGIRIENETDSPISVVLCVKRPRTGGVLRWEKGYEEIPDASWLRLEKTELDVPAKSIGLVKLFANVPDTPENYNRKWMAAVVCAPKPKEQKGGSTGIGFQIASRVGIETLPRTDVNGAEAGGLALVPSLLAYDGCIPGETFAASVKIRNNDKADHKLVVQQLEVVETDAEKQLRYFRGGSTPLIKDSWVAPIEGFTLKAGETRELKLSITIPKNAAAEKLYEQIVFLKDDTERYDFVRLRMRIAKANP